MVGQVLGAVGALPEIFTELEISYFLLRRLLGVRTEGDKKAAKVSIVPLIPRQADVSACESCLPYGTGVRLLTVPLTVDCTLV